MNEFAPFSVVFCLPGVSLLSAVPSHTTFFVRQHPTNEAFEAVKEAKGLLREGTIPPSYTSQTEENEQQLKKHEVWVDIVVEGEHATFDVEMLKNVRWEREIRRMDGDERNGADDTAKEEKHDKKIEAKLSCEILALPCSEKKRGGNAEEN
ncbi:uncharacterized protein MONOS_1899 [Monocercomonoides exilis]|uniref:uncharacterized protein n=1 Tax=Monocercomonoides exilis TaxID=2049356 RepID=UPI003559459D|nr:hypothetical protein MONOS_1899 [Monocercomonoides exilis]|eukprot:MONOS_1899.1-p1 / transcript=MONOS_1899.1 / gene=MONOS_1899 / organism=Monocercomonoides_exilis_PA203 / gene_product=unspecified product / transcript_product=unspecified product / location=Mono_scaffold00036:89835-90287(-) / protein_length=151 / sequence_SO=supercontig / SO=protein_coding / is_pseudo=false